MGNRKVVWLRNSQSFVEKYLNWCEETNGRQVAERFFDGISVNIRRIGVNPNIGKVEPTFRRAGFTVRSLLVDKHYRIFYRYNQSQVVIMAVWDMNGVIQQ